MRFFRIPARPIEDQVKAIYRTSAMFNAAVVRVFDGVDEAIVYGAELKGAYIDRIKFTTSKLAVAYENLSQLIRNLLIDIPEYPELMAELSVFKSAFTYNETPDYSLQVAQQSGLNALCLVTYDLDPTMWEYNPDIYYGFDEDRLDPSQWFPDHSGPDFNPF